MFEKNGENCGSYQCKLCDFSSKNKKGVKHHITRMHKKIESLPLNLELIEKEVEAELGLGGTTEHEFSFLPPSPKLADPNLIPSKQADFDLNVTKMYNDYVQGKESSKDTLESSPSQSTPKKLDIVSWSDKYEEKENELTLASVKIVDLEYKLRQKEVELEDRDNSILIQVEEIRQLKADLASKDEFLQTALAEDEYADNLDGDEKMKEKDLKICRYSRYISQLLGEIKSLKLKPISEEPVNYIVKRLSKENEEFRNQVKKVSEEMNNGRVALKKVEESYSLMTRNISDLRDKLNSPSIEKKISERNKEHEDETIERTVTDSREKTPDITKTPVGEVKCRFFEEQGWCRFGKSCHNLHPSRYCEWFQKVGKCPNDKCKELHSRRDCPFWARGFCKNENCRMEHDPKLKGSRKRRRSESPIKNSGLNRTYTSCSGDRKTDNYNNDIEERFREQAEQNNVLAKSLAGITAELKLLSSHHVPVQNIAWNQHPVSQATNYGTPPPPRQIPMMYPIF